MADIQGIGVDIISVARIAEVLKRHPVRFLQKLLHPHEYSDYRESKYPARFLARKFAAKEAVVKALGLGFTGGAYACKIRISHDFFGKPEVILPRGLPPFYRRFETMLSIADEKHYAVAQAIAWIRDKQP